jgi:predicted amidohydrolase YtcJ
LANAIAAFQEKDKGSLKLASADIVILSNDLMTCKERRN